MCEKSSANAAFTYQLYMAKSHHMKYFDTQFFLYKELNFFDQAFGCSRSRTDLGLKLLRRLLTN